MLGLFNTLDMAARSLDVEQEASEVTGQNLANANNAAYARETLVTSEAPAVETPIGEEGDGVQATSIQEIRDTFLDTQIQAQTGATSSLTAEQSALQNAESYLNEQIQNTSGNAAESPNGLAASLDNLFNQFQSLSTNPSDIPTMQTVVGAAQQLTSQFNQISSQLSSVESGLNQSIQSDVAGVNQDLQQVASLNLEIMQATGSGATADNLVDAREKTLEDLAGKINFTSSTGTNGAIDINISGFNMVTDGTVADTLKTGVNPRGDTSVLDTNGGIGVITTSGSINGEINARDGALETLQTNLDVLAGQLINQVNGIYKNGYDITGGTGQPLFTGTNAATIGVNSALVADPSQFQASGSATASGDNTVVLQLANLANQNIPVLGNATFSASYASTVAQLGDSISTVNNELSNSQSAGQMLANQRSSISGVSVDEEMTNLIQFQKAYEASAEMITTLDEMLQTVINMTNG